MRGRREKSKHAMEEEDDESALITRVGIGRGEGDLTRRRLDGSVPPVGPSLRPLSVPFSVLRR
jgi:hypothetical protein